MVSPLHLVEPFLTFIFLAAIDTDRLPNDPEAVRLGPDSIAKVSMPVLGVAGDFAYAGWHLVIHVSRQAGYICMVMGIGL